MHSFLWLFSLSIVEFSHVPLIGVLHVDEQDQQNIIVLKRNMQTGELDLLSIMKGSFFRQADFPSEANIASEVWYVIKFEIIFWEGLRRKMKIDRNLSYFKQDLIY